MPARSTSSISVVERREVERDGLLAERRQAGRAAASRSSGACPGVERRDHERVDARLDQLLGALRDVRAEVRRDLQRAGRVGVGDGQALDAVESEQGAGVEDPDPSDSHQPKLKTFALLHCSKR